MAIENKEFYIPHDGIRLHAKLDFPAEQNETDKYPLVIVVHGFHGHMEEPHITGVAKTLNDHGFATLRVEMYGHGESDGTFRRHTIYKWIDCMMEVMEYVGGLEFVTDLYMTGHSQGGLLTVLMAGMYADKLKAVMPLSPAMSIHYGALKGEVLGEPFDPDHIPDTLYFANGRIVDGGYFRAAQLLPVEQAIKRFHGPVLLVHGEEDEQIPFQCSVDLQKQYKNAVLRPIAGDDHCYHNHLDKVLEAVGEFAEEMKKS